MKKIKKDKILTVDEGIALISKRKEENKEEDIEQRKFLSGIGFATELGFVIAVPIAGGALLGSYLDQKLGTTPKCTLSLLFFGIIFAFYYVFRMVKEL